MQVQRPRTSNTENVAYENRSDPCGCLRPADAQKEHQQRL